MENRDKVIIRTSILGIVANLFLAAFKLVIGLITNSIAVLLDAVNNTTDVLSSVITIVGTKLAGRLPDKKHPLGHGRIEYISAMFVAALVLYAGVTSLIESVKKIINPEAPDYSVISLVIIAVAVLVKFFLGRYVKKTGERVNSGALEASGQDASFDAIISLSVLISAIIFMTTGFSLEAYVGVLISAFIIRAGIEILTDTIDELLGKRADPELTRKIKALINEEPEVYGTYDLIINNYGPDKNYVSVHVELPDTMTVDKVDVITRRLQHKLFKEMGIILTGVGVYSHNTNNDEAARLRNEVQEFVLSHEYALQMHGFYVDFESRMMRFDVVFSFSKNPNIGYKELSEEMKAKYPDFDIHIAADVDMTD